MGGESTATVAEMLERVTRIEQSVCEALKVIDAKIGHDALMFFDESLRMYRERCLREAHMTASSAVIARLAEKVRQDRDLGFPHRKIMDVLLMQYDFQLADFKEVHFSRLVREARVGKSRARAYLSTLIGKGYVLERDDGYRKCFRPRG